MFVEQKTRTVLQVLLEMGEFPQVEENEREKCTTVLYATVVVVVSEVWRHYRLQIAALSSNITFPDNTYDCPTKLDH